MAECKYFLPCISHGRKHIKICICEITRLPCLIDDGSDPKDCERRKFSERMEKWIPYRATEKATKSPKQAQFL